MKPLALASLLTLVSILTLATASGQPPEPPVRDLLRDGLYAEEVANDPAAAAKTYEKILAHFEEERPFAANALYRLAEVRRKDGRKDEAIALYQRVLSQFPDATPQAALAKTQLAALGVKTPDPAAAAPPAPPPDPEEEEMRKLEGYLTSSPDLLSRADTYSEPLEKGWIRPIAFAIKHGNSSNPRLKSELLREAVSLGQLGIVKTILATGIDPHGSELQYNLNQSCEAGYREIVLALLEAGADPNAAATSAGGDPSVLPLVLAAQYDQTGIAELLISKGADVNGTSKSPPPVKPRWARLYQPPLFIAVENQADDMVKLLLNKGADPNRIVSARESEHESPPARSPLLQACGGDSPGIIDLLLAHKADVNLADPESGITPLWMVAGKPDGAPWVKKLLDLGADPDVTSLLPARPLDWGDYFGRTTPLDCAVLKGSPESVKLLIAAMKKKNPAWKPSIPENLFKIDSKNHPRPLPSPVTLRLLLDAGAIPGDGLVRQATEMSVTDEELDQVWRLIEVLLDHGAPVDPDWIDHDFQRTSWDDHTGRMIYQGLLRRLRYPQWAGEAAIRIVDAYGRTKSVPRTASDAAPPPIATLPLEDRPKTCLLYRKDPDGKLQARSIRLSGDKDGPKLQWGDILEVKAGD